MIKRIIEARLTIKENYLESQPIHHQIQLTLESKIKKKALESMHLKRIIEQRDRLIFQLEEISRSVVPKKTGNQDHTKFSERIIKYISKKDSLPSKAAFILIKDGPSTFIRCLTAYLKKGSGYAASERWIPRDISKKSYDDLNNEIEYLNNIISRKDKEIGNLLSHTN
jgi:hypothetical protein